ncbi:MAG: hypothetical protein P4L33_15755 [Capsulimonadaceae bacterium]|nr:hypothetical protein [Capsulimonadaceae bacterium]
MSTTSDAQALAFLNDDQQFRLGFLPTEQSNPKTKDLDKAFSRSTVEGVKLLLSVDRDITPMARKVFASAEFQRMENAMAEALLGTGRIIFSGCGATGRLSILLESMWRHSAPPELKDKVASLMTGGDYALIRSVESFEDYGEFGRQQTRELGVRAGDVFVAITEGGETYSVLGSVREAADRGASAFLLFNNPADILREKLVRCREAIDDPRITTLDLCCGPMAVAGSTRMQATTSEQLIAGAALENALFRLLQRSDTLKRSGATLSNRLDWISGFERLLDDLVKPDALAAMAEQIEFEETLYRSQGLVTYCASAGLLDILTDTTERAPTFTLPPFRNRDDNISPPSWAFVKDPLLPTPQAWTAHLGRPPRCLNWGRAEYRRMGASARLMEDPPKLDADQLFKFEIGCEQDLSRLSPAGNAAILVILGEELCNPAFDELDTAFARFSEPYSLCRRLAIGGDSARSGFLHVPCVTEKSSLSLLGHLAMKLVLNTVSTGTMARLGRITGNWMSFVSVSNKKLLDRSVRLIAELCELDYETACRELFETMDALNARRDAVSRFQSPAQETISRIRTRNAEVNASQHISNRGSVSNREKRAIH